MTFLRDQDAGQVETSQPPAFGLRGAAGVSPVLLFVLASFALLTGLVLHATSGHFTYTLDDPYIHLALADNIARGHYGINPYESSSPSSSILWPFLLSITAAMPFQDWMPLFWNLLATAGSGLVLLAVFSHSVKSTLAAVSLSLAVLTGLNIVGVAFTGLEHSSQIFAALLVGHGLVGLLRGRVERVPSWFTAAVVVGPLLRYESAALSAAAAIVLFTIPRLRSYALTVTALWGGLMLAFSLYLQSIGLDPLPSSVLAKSNYSTGAPLVSALTAHVGVATSQTSILACLTVLVLDVLLLRRWGRLHTYVLLALAAHAVGGSFGWLHRYELYVLAGVLPVLVGLASEWLPERGAAGIVPLAAATLMTATAMVPFVRTTAMTPVASAAIWGEQAQTALFVRDYWKRPIAVNDLGLVAYRGTQPVVDLYGLANQEIRRARLESEPGWLGKSVQEHRVGLVAVYKSWFPGQIPGSWIPVGRLTLDTSPPNVDRTVDFFAVEWRWASRACTALRAFSSEVPAGTRIIAARPTCG